MQRLVQGTSVAQAALTCLLASISHSALVLYVLGDALGLAASFARVQRQHSACTSCNLAWLLSSVGRLLALIASLIRGHAPVGIIVGSLLVAATSVAGSALAAYVLYRPLLLYRYGPSAQPRHRPQPHPSPAHCDVSAKRRYESVAMDEETADKRSERHAGRGGELAIGQHAPARLSLAGRTRSALP